MRWEDFFRRAKKPLKWFKDCCCLKAGKAQYRELMLKHHPDKGGDVEVAKEINAEYDIFILQAVKEEPKSHKASFDESYQGERMKYTDEFFKTLRACMDMNADVEVIGTWIWLWNVSPGDVFQVVMMRFTHSRKHGGWFWYDPEVQEWNRNIGPRREYSTDDLRDMWGHEKRKDKRYL